MIRIVETAILLIFDLKKAHFYWFLLLLTQLGALSSMASPPINPTVASIKK